MGTTDDGIWPGQEPRSSRIGIGSQKYFQVASFAAQPVDTISFGKVTSRGRCRSVRDGACQASNGLASYWGSTPSSSSRNQKPFDRESSSCMMKVSLASAFQC